MSQENEQLACRFFYALHRRDYDTVRSCLHPDAESHNTAAFPGRGTVIGPRQIVEFWRDLLESFVDIEAGAHVEQVQSSGVVVVIGVRSWGLSATAGLPVDVRWGLTLRVRGGRIERADVSGDYWKALQAAGLPEWAMSHENVEIVQRVFEACFERRDREEWASMLHPEIECVRSRNSPEQSVTLGGSSPSGGTRRRSVR